MQTPAHRCARVKSWWKSHAIRTEMKMDFLILWLQCMTEFPNTFPRIQELRATHSNWINFEIKNPMAHMALIISNK